MTTKIDLTTEAGHIVLNQMATDFWYWAPNYVATEDEENETVRFFPTPEKFKYLHSFTRTMDEKNTIVVLKSRRLMITWTVILRFLWKAQFTGMGIPGCPTAFRAAILSVDEDAVKDNIRHLTDVWERMPKWLKELNPIVTKNKMEIEFKLGGAIKGFSLKAAGPRTYGFSEMLFDEMAFQAFARTTWTGAKPTLGKNGKMIAVSTPNGKGNFFYRIFADPDKEFSGVTRMRIGWKANPEHDQEWFDGNTGSMDQQSINREYRLSFTSAAGRPVFSKDFNETANLLGADFDPPEYNPARPVLQGWDMGYHFPAYVIGQMNAQDQLIGFYATTGNDEEISDFGKRMKEIRSTFFPPDARFIHFVPPDSMKRYSSESKGGHVSDYDSLFNPQTGILAREQAFKGKIENAARLGSVRKALKLRADGNSGMIISRKGCADLVDGFLGGYCYPQIEKLIQNPEKGEEPEKNEYSHAQDALQMITSGYDIIIYMQKAQDKKSKRKNKKSIAGKTNWRIGT